MVLVSRKGKQRKQMTMQSNIRTIDTIAKQVGHMSAGWLAINSLSCDRTPEGYFSSGFLEGSGIA